MAKHSTQIFALVWHKTLGKLNQLPALFRNPKNKLIERKWAIPHLQLKSLARQRGSWCPFARSPKSTDSRGAIWTLSMSMDGKS
jgi:hypothetical protein